MKYIFTLPLFVFLAVSATAQDYHLFPNPSDTLAFADQGDNLRHIRFDSTKTDGNTTTYFPMKEVSFGMPDDTCWGRNPFDGWIGRSISDSLGTFHFVHESYDFRVNVNDLSTSFQTVGSLKGDTTDFILELKYDSTSYRSIAMGGSDSLRHFSLRAMDPNGQRPATFPNDRLISVSKNHGLMQFPQLIGGAKNLSRTSHVVLTKADIYDHELGDEFHYRFGTYSITHPQGNESRRSKRILIDKQVFPAQDSIYYLWQEHFVHEDPSRPPPNNFITGVDTLAQGVGNASAPQPHLLSYETGFSEHDPAYLYHQAHAINGRPGYTIHENHYEYGADTICILPALEPSMRVTKMAAGIGLVNDEYASHQTKRQVKNRLVYYKKGSETWGTPLADFSIHELQRQAFSIYPNPVKDVFSIQLPKGEDPFSIRIYNQVGQKVLETEIRPGENAISMAKMPKGVYFVQSEAGTVKVVKE